MSSRSYRLYLEIDLYQTLPALYRDGVMEYTNIQTILYSIFSSIQ